MEQGPYGSGVRSEQGQLRFEASWRCWPETDVRLQSGDHVRVMSGLSEGKTGMVVRVEDHLCILLADHSREELRVFSRNLQEISDVASAVGEEMHAYVTFAPECRELLLCVTCTVECT